MAQQQTRIYIAPDDHTDLMWTADEASYQQALTDMLDYYLGLTDSTMGNAPPFQSRFAADGSFWLWTYERNRSRAQFDQLISRIRDGHVSSPLNTLVSTYGAMPAEAVLRSLYYAGHIERRYGLRFPMALAMENQGLPYGLGSLFAGSGAKYSWRGICNCNTSTPNAATREHDIYWWVGPDGSRILMKWNSMLGNSQKLGGYAESFDPPQSVEDASAYIGTAKWPYNIIASFGRGWDFLETKTDAFVSTAMTKTNATRQVIDSNEEDFFRDFEMTYGASLPNVSASFGNDWDLCSASLAEVSASARRSIEKLRSAEAIETLVALRVPSFLSSRAAARDQFNIDTGKYWEHNWTANGNISKSDRAAWQRGIASEMSSYVDTLTSDGTAALGGLIGKSGTNPRFFAFNPLGSSRTDVADFPYAGSSPVHVMDVTAGTEVPSQLVTVGGTQKLRILASNVPAVGYKVFEIVPGAGSSFPAAATVTGNVFENDRYRVTVASSGAITSLIDKTRGNREFIQQVNGRFANDLGGGSGTLSVESAGPVSVTLLATAGTPLAHNSHITLFNGIDRVDIVDEITQNFTNLQTWGFGFNLDTPDLWHEEVGAVVKAKQLTENGQYSNVNARYDWLTMNHFADMVSETSPVGITLSNADLAFMQMGASTITNLDDVTPSINPLAGGQTDAPLGIPGQGGDSYFLQRFALHTHDALDVVADMRFSLEHQNPLVTGAVTGAGFSGSAAAYPANTYSLVTISDPNAILWAVKPAEEGIGAGIVTRLWNLSGSSVPFTLNLPNPIAAARQLTHIETDIAAASLAGGALSATLGPRQMQTFRLLSAAPPTPGLSFYTVTPCRLTDTRSDNTPLLSGETRTIPVTGHCGIPSTAVSIAANVTAVSPNALGNLNAYASGTLAPFTSTLNFKANTVRANNAVVELGADGGVNISASLAGSGSTSHVLLDVFGYFQ
ncbi:MAG: glycosyl hydrolase-related protein [Acidobacteriota bacterium]|nr:glycosyl hydrolase-related protein [Acidobacteriota bacterium]